MGVYLWISVDVWMSWTFCDPNRSYITDAGDFARPCVLHSVEIGGDVLTVSAETNMDCPGSQTLTSPGAARTQNLTLDVPSEGCDSENSSAHCWAPFRRISRQEGIGSPEKTTRAATTTRWWKCRTLSCGQLSEPLAWTERSDSAVVSKWWLD